MHRNGQVADGQVRSLGSDLCVMPGRLKGWMDSPDDGKHVEKHESDIGNYPLVI